MAEAKQDELVDAEVVHSEAEPVPIQKPSATERTLGMRSVKLRHHNGPLHTIPYGQLGAVTNQSRDFATIKFNLRLEPGTDIELVRRTAKRVGLEMQEIPEIATEVMLPGAVPVFEIRTSTLLLEPTFVSGRAMVWPGASGVTTPACSKS